MAQRLAVARAVRMGLRSFAGGCRAGGSGSGRAAALLHDLPGASTRWATGAGQWKEGAAQSFEQQCRGGIGYRLFSSEGGGTQDTETNPSKSEVAADGEETAVAEESSAAPDTTSLTAEGSIGRGVAIGAGKAILPRYGDGPKNNLNEMAEGLEEYFESLPEFPVEGPIYDIPQYLGEEAMQDTEDADAFLESLESPEALALFDEPEEEPPYPGAKQILHWTQHAVLKSIWGNEPTHPINKKVECEVHMKELQDELALADDAVKHIIAVCGPRYHPTTGILRLVSERYPQREDNRRHIVDQIGDLVEEGKRLFPNPNEEADRAAHRERCRKEAEELGRKIAASMPPETEHAAKA
mmetsp:Transcript_29147/g.82172  ORF Transcript_29147/g.82172 Transcript_29147/m.82172 type:complete len:354 (-) Transcript_29147:61-1122(-)|eukprot:CAMPEP_0117674880 /NCGR_PEP_ID=MMETSP0804-20121206/15295_1 /TAXON_ID=1074897 /ORGANISM="Tetraselmis astigmatica, Strain CCMP880" /LENGTH=353 /DNA_ID=CAMNT_0005483821 /DNA_START=22 /DNA_END=1083 /DNA_ORIENTATION=+